jgi:DNA-directed RNA polymerase subunit beta
MREFFGRSQLSQFKDQTNPLSELRHKSAASPPWGPGGLTRERAGFDVRDVHRTHYGRICPHRNARRCQHRSDLLAGLLWPGGRPWALSSPRTARSRTGVVTDQVDFMTAYRRRPLRHCPGQHAPQGRRLLRYPAGGGQAQEGRARWSWRPEEVEYMDVSPKQIFSVNTNLIPFLEHDDANRALMGSNMQTQAVPLIRAQAPVVMTGLEERVVRDSLAALYAEEDGEVVSTWTAPKSLVRGTKTRPPGTSSPLAPLYARSNQGTALDQRPRVRVGQKVKQGRAAGRWPGLRGGLPGLGTKHPASHHAL